MYSLHLTMREENVSTSVDVIDKMVTPTTEESENDDEEVRRVVTPIAAETPDRLSVGTNVESLLPTKSHLILGGNLSPTHTEKTVDVCDDEVDDDQFDMLELPNTGSQRTPCDLDEMLLAGSADAAVTQQQQQRSLEESSVCSVNSQVTVKISNKSPGRESSAVVAPPRPTRLFIPTQEDLHRSNEEEVKRLQNVAKSLSQRGKELEAIRVYHRALRLMKQDSTRIKKGLGSAATGNKKPTRSLHDEWMKLATCLAEIRTVMAILYERLGSYNKAISSCEEAKQMYLTYEKIVAKHGLSDPDLDGYLGQMLVMEKKLYRSKNSFESRRAAHEEAIEWRRRCLIARTEAEKENCYRQAFATLANALEMETSSLGASHPQVADTICMFGTMHFERNEMNMSITQYTAASKVLRSSLGPYHPRTGLAVRSLARAYETRRKDKSDLDTAMKYYEEACECFKEAYGVAHGMVGATLNNIAVIYIQLGEVDRAVEKLSDALVSYESVICVEPGSINADAAQVWKNLGECYGRRREWENAHFAYMSALEVQRDARKVLHEQAQSTNGAPAANQALLKQRGCDDVSLADTLLRLGRATKETGRHEQSYHIQKEALGIFKFQYKAAKKQGRMTPALVDFQDRLAHSLYCIAETQEIRGKYDEAVRIYSESLNLRLSTDAQRSGSNMNMIHCAMALAGIGSIHMKRREFADACTVYKESIGFLDAHGVPMDHELQRAIRVRLHEAKVGTIQASSFDSEESFDSGDPNKKDRTLIMDKEAQQQMQAKEYDGAIATLTRILAIRRRRLTKKQRDEAASNNVNPTLKEKDDVARTLGNFATVLRMKGEQKQAKMLFSEAIDLYKSNGHSDQDPLILDLIKELKKKHSAIESLSGDGPINLVDEERAHRDEGWTPSMAEL